MKKHYWGYSFHYEVHWLLIYIVCFFSGFSANGFKYSWDYQCLCIFWECVGTWWWFFSSYCSLTFVSLLQMLNLQMYSFLFFLSKKKVYYCKVLLLPHCKSVFGICLSRSFSAPTPVSLFPLFCNSYVLVNRSILANIPCVWGLSLFYCVWHYVGYKVTISYETVSVVTWRINVNVHEVFVSNVTRGGCGYCIGFWHPYWLNMSPTNVSVSGIV